MKPITKLAFIAAVAALGTGVAQADNSQQQNLLELQRRAAERDQASATVGVYVGGQGVRHQTMVEHAPRTEAGVQLQRNSHGGFYVAPAPSYR
jgi:hypothetical protein